MLYLSMSGCVLFDDDSVAAGESSYSSELVIPGGLVMVLKSVEGRARAYKILP